MPSQETLQQSANYPVLVTPNPMAAAQVKGEAFRRSWFFGRYKHAVQL
jgi:hypothetical protein